MVKCLPEFEYFTAFLKNKNIIFKIRRSKVTDYAALTFSSHLSGVDLWILKYRMGGELLQASQTSFVFPMNLTLSSTGSILSNTDLSDLSTVGTCDIFVYQMRQRVM